MPPSAKQEFGRWLPEWNLREWKLRDARHSRCRQGVGWTSARDPVCDSARSTMGLLDRLEHSAGGSMMHRYRVVERWDESDLCALQCHTGQYHVARSLNAMPPLHAALDGTKPHLGFCLLVCAASGAIFRVIFESINDTYPLFRGSGTARVKLVVARVMQLSAEYGARRLPC